MMSSTFYLKQLLQTHQCLLVIFTPDCLRSALRPNIEHFIWEKTGLKPYFRFWRRIDIEIAEKLYVHNIANIVPSWHLVTSLLTEGPLLSTVYLTNENNYRQITDLKGARHPADALEDTIRGSFWCDNTVCNLVHISDNPDSAARELKLLAYSSDVIDGVLVKNIATPIFEPWKYVSHSGIITLYKIIRRQLEIEDIFPFDELVVPESGSSRATFIAVKNKLNELATASSKIRELLELYFIGDTENIALSLEQFSPPTKWEKLVIKCSTASIGMWLKSSLEEVIREITQLLGSWNIGEWVVGASAAMRMYGLNVTPSDIDIRCSEKALMAISNKLNQPINQEQCGKYTVNVVEIKMRGWDVEFVGNLNFKQEISVAVDDLMMEKERPNPILQSIEDLIAEFLAMKREPFQKDLYKAQQLLRVFSSQLDFDYLKQRMQKWKVNIELLEFLCKN